MDFSTEIQQILRDENDPDSHTELDPHSFHASQIGFCKRQAYLGKLGLKDNSDALGAFRTGTMIHEFLEEQLGKRHERLQFEQPIEFEEDGIRFVGHYDCYDPEAGALYDFKSRASFYRFSPPYERHIDQLYVYMYGLKAHKARVVYVSKGDLEVREYPGSDGYVVFDPERFTKILDRAKEIRDAIEEYGVATAPEEIPFEKCGCYFCDEEQLDLPNTAPALDRAGATSEVSA